MRDQFLNLIVTPTKATSESVSTPRPLIIVIDALDECANQNDVRDVLTIIRQYSPTLPLKFFITSRPERQIQHVFRQKGTSRYSKFILHEIEKDIVSVDDRNICERGIDHYCRRTNGWDANQQLASWVLLFVSRARCSSTPRPHVNMLVVKAALWSALKMWRLTCTDVSPNSLNSETSALDDLYGHIFSAAFRVANAREKDEIQKVRAVVSVMQIRQSCGCAMADNILIFRAVSVMSLGILTRGNMLRTSFPIVSWNNMEISSWKGLLRQGSLVVGLCPVQSTVNR